MLQALLECKANPAAANKVIAASRALTRKSMAKR
jgi:hypothetical protein